MAKMQYEYKGSFDFIKYDIDLPSIKYRMFKKIDNGNIIINVVNHQNYFEENTLEIYVNDRKWFNSIELYTIQFYNMVMPLAFDLSIRNYSNTMKEYVNIEYHNCVIMNSENFVSGKILEKEMSDDESSAITFRNCSFIGDSDE